MPEDKWFKLFASCILVEGSGSSAIYDLERFAIYDIPNEYAELLKYSEAHRINSIKAKYSIDQHESIEIFFSQFVDKELGFYTKSPENFPKINFEYEFPAIISNSVIELDNLYVHNLKSIIKQLDDVFCKAIQIRILKKLTYNELIDAVTIPFINSQVDHLEIIIPYDAGISLEKLITLLEAQPRIRKILIYNGDSDRILYNDDRTGRKIFEFKKNISLDKSEKIRLERFVATVSIFAEALSYNLGLNRKVCIDKDGNIKNYLTHSKIYGNVNSDIISSVVSSKEFQFYWNTSNDKIEGCNLCQYRYACISNSDLICKDQKIYKKETCEYNPETNQWS